MEQDSRRTLTTFGGVFCPVTLSQFSSIVFLRLGFFVGQCGLYLTLLQLVLAYILLILTVLSISAISTNGAISGGGVYFMLSRTLGPQIGGSIGILFYISQVFSAALYVSAAVEGICTNFGPTGLLVHGLPGDSRWWQYLYATVIMLICFMIVMIGSNFFAKVSLLILGCVIFIIFCVIGSFFQSAMSIPIPLSNKYIYPTPTNVTQYGNFTGFNKETFVTNLNSNFTIDYVSGNEMSFIIAFAVLVSGITGIMNGANMSGELKEPAKSIPRGTLGALAFTFSIYFILIVFTSSTCDRYLLINNYVYMQGFVFWGPLVTIGVLLTTISAGLGNLIGASRILEALANDNLFGIVLKYAKWTTKGGNPVVAVIITHLLTMLVMLIGSLNAIAPAVSVFFLLAYGVTNFACAVLDIASAANFRPLFKYFHWVACLLCGTYSLILCCLVQPVYAFFAMIAFIAVAAILSMRKLPASWGSITQALIFHQVRKYLLMLDDRKSHMKYWRPQLLLLVNSPRNSASLVQFMNSVKKGGLYVLAHVIVGDWRKYPQCDTSTKSDVCERARSVWQRYSESLRTKAFVEVTSCDEKSNLSDAIINLIRISGLGGMKPNTVCLGFYDNQPHKDTYTSIQKLMHKQKVLRVSAKASRFFASRREDRENLVIEEVKSGSSMDDDEFNIDHLPADLSTKAFNKNIADHKQNGDRLSPVDYVNLLQDIFLMGKNLLVSRNFNDILCAELMPNDVDYYQASDLAESIMTFNPNPDPEEDTFHCPSTGTLVGLTFEVEDGTVKSIKNVTNSRPSPPKANYLDLYPINFLDFFRDKTLEITKSSKFMLQIACLVGRARKMTQQALPFVLRILIPVYTNGSNPLEEISKTKEMFANLLISLRINAVVKLFPVESIISSSRDFGMQSTTSKYESINQLIRSKCVKETKVVMLDFILPKSRCSNDKEAQEYLDYMSALSNNLPPTLFVHGIEEVTSIEL